MEDRRVTLLQRMPIFGAIDARTIEFLLHEAQTAYVQAGEYFFREGETAEAMFVLECGRVSILKRWEDRDYPLVQMGAGECFGEMALIDLLPRSASVLALEDCAAVRLTHTDLYRVYQTNLAQFALIQMNVSRELSRRLRKADERLFQFQREPSMQDESAFGCWSI